MMADDSRHTVPAKFREAVAKWGDRVAMRKKEYGLWHDITWNDYARKVRSVACALMSMGLEKGDCAAIIGDNCPEWVFADIGIQCCGAAATGVYATNAWQQVEYVVTNSESKFLFVENEEQLDKWLHFRENAPHLAKVIVWDTEGLRQFKDTMVITFAELLEIGESVNRDHPQMLDERVEQVEPDDLAVVIYTSGTTGSPKGAMLTHRNCVWMGWAITHNNPMHDNDEIMSFLQSIPSFSCSENRIGVILSSSPTRTRVGALTLPRCWL